MRNCSLLPALWAGSHLLILASCQRALENVTLPSTLAYYLSWKPESLLKSMGSVQLLALLAGPNWREKMELASKRKTILHGSFESIKLIFFD